MRAAHHRGEVSRAAHTQLTATRRRRGASNTVPPMHPVSARTHICATLVGRGGRPLLSLAPAVRWGRGVPVVRREGRRPSGCPAPRPLPVRRAQGARRTRQSPRGNTGGGPPTPTAFRIGGQCSNLRSHFPRFFMPHILDTPLETEKNWFFLVVETTHRFRRFRFHRHIHRVRPTFGFSLVQPWPRSMRSRGCATWRPSRSPRETEEERNRSRAPTCAPQPPAPP